jgi:hypothetical protein
LKLTRIYVTAEDIAKGNECRKDVSNKRSESCAITWALKRTFNTDDAWWAITSGRYDGISVEATKDYAPIVATFVHGHDSGVTDVHPFSFTIKPLLGMGVSE